MLLEIVNPTWSQAFHYAFKSGHLITFVFGLLLFISAVVLFVLHSQDRIKVKFLEKGINFVLFVLLAASFTFIMAKPGTIRFNNEFKIEGNELQHYISDNYHAFYDSLYQANRLIGAAKK